jgi:hypothetical protein
MPDVKFSAAANLVFDRDALDAMSIHLKAGCVFRPVFEPLEYGERDGQPVVLSARLAAIQMVQLAPAAPAPKAPMVPRGKVKAA